MLARTAQVARVTRRFALAVAVLVAGVLPAAVLTVGYEHEDGAVEAKLEIAASHINDLVNSSPDLWQLQIHRIEDILMRHRPASSEVWTIRDAQGRLIITVGADGQRFQLARAQPLLDAGERVGEIRLARSLTAVLTWTAGAALASGLLGIGLYIVLRVLPIRALERSEGRLLAIMDSAPDAFLMLDPIGRITLSNASAATLFGLSPPEMAGQRLSQLVTESGRPMLEAMIEKFRDAGGSPRDTAETMELTGLAPRRDDFPVEARFSAWRTDAETSIVCVLRDVTDRKKAEAALDESREQSVTLLTVSRQVSGMLDITEMMRRVARETGRALGADMVGVFLADAKHETLRPIAAYHVPKHVLEDFMAAPIPLKGHPFLEEAWEQRRAVAIADTASDPRMDQEFLRRLPHRSSLFYPLVVQGEPIGGVFVIWFERAHRFAAPELRLVEGISGQAGIAIARARLVTELQTRQTRLESLLAIGRELSRIQPVEPLLNRVAEACGRLFDAESAAFRLRDGEDLQVCGTWGTAQDLMPSPALKVGESLTGIVAATGEPLIADDPGNDPRLIPLHRERYRRAGIRAFLGVPVKVDERVVGVLTIRITRDGSFSADDVEIARAFAAQAAIALENSRLYEETQSALRELSQTRDQLVQSQKMEAIGQLAGGVAHDFNNLLTVIIGRSQLFLARVAVGDPGRRDVEMVNRAAERAASLTRQLLAFSRKQVLKPEPLDLNALVGGLAPMLRRLIGEHIDLVIAPGGDLGQVMADPGQIEQVVMNLVVNARDAMPDGGTMRVQTEHAQLGATRAHLEGRIPPGDYVAVEVQDTGSGMDPATIARIFEPFFTTKEPGKGTGLGLSTVYGIVNQSGGHIGVDSAPGRGTTFTIYLPRTALPVPSPTRGRETVAMVGGSETILLVEDEDEVRQLARDVLESCGYTVLATGDPREALSIADRRGEEIDLLVTDMVMPTIRGSVLAARLRRQLPALPLLYVSGYTDEMATPGGKIEPPAPLLQKPFTPPALARAVRDVLDAGFVAGVGGNSGDWPSGASSGTVGV
jgi:PAS domain S-box-containing protein